MKIKETYETFLAQTGNDLVAASLTLASVLQAEQQPPMLTVDEAALRLERVRLLPMSRRTCQ